MKRTTRAIGLVSLLPLVGCGSGIQDAILLAGRTGTQTFTDILISDVFADLPDLLRFPSGLGTSTGTGTNATTNGNTGAKGAVDAFGG